MTFSLYLAYLSVMRDAALGGLIKKLQQGRPAVWCLMFNHNCTQLGQSMLHGVPAKERQIDDNSVTCDISHMSIAACASSSLTRFPA